MTLNWNIVSGAVSYRIRRTTTSGIGYSPVGETTEHSWTDTNVAYEPGVLYFYVIVAVDHEGVEGEPSAEIPYQLPVVTAPVPTLVEGALSWSAVPGAQRYIVKRSHDSVNRGWNFLPIAELTGTSLAIEDPGTYFYVVTAVTGTVECDSAPIVSTL